MPPSQSNSQPLPDDLESIVPLEGAVPVSRPVQGTGALVAAGSFWSLSQTLVTKVVTLLCQLALGWILSRKDFGQIGMAYTVTAFVSLLINPGIDVILVRRGKKFHLWSTPAFYFSLATGLLGSLVILAVAPLAARIYGASQLFGLLAILAIATPFGSLLLVPTAKLRSEMRFSTLAGIALVQSVFQALLTVGFAVAGFGVYSFVLPMPFVYITVAVLLWWIARPVVRRHHPLQYWRYLIGDSSYLFGMRLLQVLVGQGDYMILGALYGDSVVGPYFFAYLFAQQAVRLTAGSIQLVLMAGLARMPSFSPQQTRAALRTTEAIALVGMPLCVLQAVVAGPLLHGFYGNKWDEAVPLVQLISVGMAFDVTSWTVVSLMQSRGQFRLLFGWAVAFATMFLAAIFIGALYGEALGVSAAVCLYYIVLSPLFAYLAFRASNVSGREVLAIYTRPIFVSMLMAGASLAAISLCNMAGWPAVIQTVVGIVMGLVTMGVAARLIMPATCEDIFTRLKRLLPFLSPVRSLISRGR